MDKKILGFGILAAAAGIGLGLLRSPARKAASAAEDVFAPEKLKGYVENTRIRIMDDGKSKSGLSGGPVVAVAVTPFGIRPDQVSPTGYGALKALRQQFKKSDWIAVFVAEDSAMAEASNWVGLAEYRKGQVTVTGGIPSPEEFSAASPGAGRPTPEDLRVAAAVFDSTASLSSDRWDLSQNLLGAGQGRVDKSRFLDLDLETNSLHAVAKSLGRDPKAVQAAVLKVTRFYWLKAGEPL